MADQNDTEYYARRAEAARIAAEKAGDPAARIIHDTMAARYAQLAGSGFSLREVPAPQ